MRSLVNVPLQYASALLPQRVNRLTPFLEGPIVNMFFGYELNEMHCLDIKPELEFLFKYHCGVSHRVLVERSLASMDKSNINDFGLKIGHEMDKNEFQIKAQHAINYLSKMLSASDMSLSLKGAIKSPDQLLRLASLL